LRSTIRHGDLVARFGGDEFVIVLEGPPGRIEPEALARIAQALGAGVLVDGEPMLIRLSVGVASVVQGTSMSADQLLSAADSHMYAQKRTRNPMLAAPSGATPRT